MSHENIASSSSPLPVPRLRVPVPLPRSKLPEVLEPSSETEVSSCPNSSKKNSNEVTIEPTDSRCSSLRKSLRLVTANVQEGSKLVGAKLEKSVKNILKRNSSASIDEGESREETDSIRDDLSEVFSEIKFGSPLVSQERSLPPPYPPPPLPEETFLEVSSVHSSGADSHYSYPTSVFKSESLYEEIPFRKKQSDTGSECSSTGASDKLFRSDSWNYYLSPNDNVKLNLPTAQQVSTTHSSSPSTSDSSRMEHCILHSYENFIPTLVNTIKSENIYSTSPSDKQAHSVASFGSLESSQSIANSVYENWGPIAGEDLTPLEKINSRPLLLHSDMVVCEFDPLMAEGSEAGLSTEATESQISSGGEEELVDEQGEGIPDEEVSEEGGATPKKGINRWSSMKKKAIETFRGSRTKAEKVLPQPPSLPARSSSPLPNSLHAGYLYKVGSLLELPRGVTKKWCQLGEGRLSFSQDKGQACKDSLHLEHISSVQIIFDPKQSDTHETIHCWELVHAGKGKPYTVGCSAPTERRIWMQKILEALTSAFPPSLSSSYSRAGWLYLREYIHGPWHIAWLLLQKRTLYYSVNKGKSVDIDLRKMVNLNISSRNESEILVLDTQEKSIRMLAVRDLKSWAKAIKSAAVDNGTSLSEQQLTKDNIPTIVDKCISFVYAHGCMSEGIYRKSGSNAHTQQLLTDLRKDAWAVRIIREEYSEYDVSAALKRFFRDLPDPLFTAEQHDYFCSAANIKCNKSDKISMYRGILEKLPLVNYVTARKLLSHLHFVSQQSDKNLMNVENLSAIWAPTLMHVQDGENSKWSQQEYQVLFDLITFYKPIFLVGETELVIEKRIKEVLEKVHSQGGPNHHQPSGDLKIWVYVGSKESGPCISVTVDPEVSAAEVVDQVCKQVKPPLDCRQSCLQEVCLGGALLRPLHHTEKVFNTVIRWAYWDASHAKENCLLLVPNTALRLISSAANVSPPLSKCDLLKFASPKMKSFKTHLFEFSQAKLSYFKDSKLTVKLGEWRIEDISIYLGHDKRRNINAKWTLTVIPINYASNSSKEYGFGFILGGIKDDLVEWLTAFMVAQYSPSELLPPASVTNLVSCS